MPTTSRYSTSPGTHLDGVNPSLLDALSEGMHTLAQPLTVLRATLEIAWGNASSISHYQRAIDTSLTEVSRVAEAMGFVRELLRIAREIPDPAPLDVHALIGVVHDDLRCVLDTAGVSLSLDVAPNLPPILGSAPRLRQCLVYLLQHAVSLCRIAGAIELEANRREDEVCLLLRLWSSEPALDETAAARHNLWGNFIPCLTLADALARTSGGRLEWQTDPFAAYLSLPAIRPHPETQDPWDTSA